MAIIAYRPAGSGNYCPVCFPHHVKTPCFRAFYHTGIATAKNPKDYRYD
jgi:hypothetical protein